MTNYTSLSDFEINQCVMAAKGINPRRVLPTPDYCNNWADAGPIIVENKIAIYEEDGEWFAASDFYVHHSGQADWDYWAYSNNPLRAAMVVFLMMKEGE